MLSWKNSKITESKDFSMTFHYKRISKILPNTYLSTKSSENKKDMMKLSKMQEVPNATGKQTRNLNSPLLFKAEGRLLSPQSEVINAFSPIKSRNLNNRGIRALKPLFKNFE